MPKNSAWRAPRSLPTLLTRLYSRPSGAGEIIARTAYAAHLTLNFGVLLHKLWRIDNSRSDPPARAARKTRYTLCHSNYLCVCPLHNLCRVGPARGSSYCSPLGLVTICSADRLQLNAFLLASINLLKRRQRASNQSAKAPQSNCRAACVCSPGGHDQCWGLHQVMQKDAQSVLVAANSLIDRQAGSELTCVRRRCRLCST